MSDKEVMTPRKPKPVKAWAMQWPTGQISLLLDWTRLESLSRHAEFIQNCGCKIVRVEVCIIKPEGKRK